MKLHPNDVSLIVNALHEKAKANSVAADKLHGDNTAVQEQLMVDANRALDLADMMATSEVLLEGEDE